MSGYDMAKRFIGYHEVRNRTQLIKFFKQYKLNIDPSTTPWCAAFVNACEREEGNRGTGMLNARSFLNYGRKIDEKDVKMGDIVIFSRGGSSWQGHVAYFVKWADKYTIMTLGGNQGDMVKYSWYPKSRLIGIRRV